MTKVTQNIIGKDFFYKYYLRMTEKWYEVAVKLRKQAEKCFGLNDKHFKVFY